MSSTNTRMTLVPSPSSVSIRFLISTADSSWAVPSVVSRSSSALTMPVHHDPREPDHDRRDDDDQQDGQQHVLGEVDQPRLQVPGELHGALA